MLIVMDSMKVADWQIAGVECIFMRVSGFQSHTELCKLSSLDQVGIDERLMDCIRYMRIGSPYTFYNKYLMEDA